MVHIVCSNFVYWHLPQLKYKNPEVQMVTVKMMTPTPWIKVYFGRTSMFCCFGSIALRSMFVSFRNVLYFFTCIVSVTLVCMKAVLSCMHATNVTIDCFRG